MRVLLDTHTLIWAMLDQQRLTERGRGLLSDPGQDLLISIVSAWEIAIKQGLGKLSPPSDLRQAVNDAGLDYLQISPEHCHAYGLLPHDGAHRDPFDRMLVVQAMAEDAYLLSRDPALDRYDVRRIW